METVYEKEIFRLKGSDKEYIESKQSIVWAKDANIAALCCSGFLKILNMTSAPFVSGHTDCYRLNIENTEEINTVDPVLSIPKGLVDFGKSLDCLDKQDRWMFFLDPSLNGGPFFQNASFASFRSASFSPTFSNMERPLICAVTYGHRAVIYEYKSCVWKCIVDVSEILKQSLLNDVSLPIILGKTVNLDVYQELVGTMSIVLMEWSHVLKTSPQGDKSTIWMFICTKAGIVSVWEVSVPISGSEDLVLKSSTKVMSEVTSLCWQPETDNCGILCIGTIDGSLICLKVEQTIDDVVVTDIHNDKFDDGLVVADMAVSTVQQHVHALVVCKEYFLLLYSIDQGKIKHISNVHIEHNYPLNSISLRSKEGLAVTEGCGIFHLKLNYSDGILSMSQSSVRLQSLPLIDDITWQCLGSAISLNALVSIYVLKPTRYHTAINKIKGPFNHMVCLQIKDKCWQDFFETDSFTTDFQDVFISASYKSQMNLKLIENHTTVISYVKSLIDKDSTKALQLSRLLATSLANAKLAIEDDDASQEWINTTIHQITERLLVKQAQLIIKSRKTVSKELVHSAMWWLKKTREEEEDESIDLQVPDYKCSMCESNLNSVDVLVAKCEKGHRNKLCCLSLGPYEETNERYCLSCYQGASSFKTLFDNNLPGDRNHCVLCGGNLQSLFL